MKIVVSPTKAKELFDKADHTIKSLERDGVPPLRDWESKAVFEATMHVMAMRQSILDGISTYGKTTLIEWWADPIRMKNKSVCLEIPIEARSDLDVATFVPGTICQICDIFPFGLKIHSGQYASILFWSEVRDEAIKQIK